MKRDPLQLAVDGLSVVCFAGMIAGVYVLAFTLGLPFMLIGWLNAPPEREVERGPHM